MDKLVLLVIVTCWMHLSMAATTFQLEFLAEIIAENELKVTCDSDHENERVGLVSAARCGVPRDVLINLPSSEDNVVKATLWEGGVRGAGLLWSPRVSRAPRLARQTMHVAGWLPTLYSAAGGDVANLTNMDGVDLWKSLVEDTQSPRTEVLHNIDDIFGNAALTVRGWKVVKGTAYGGDWDNWYGPSGREGAYDVDKVVGSRAGEAVAALRLLPNTTTLSSLRAKATVSCGAAAAAARARPTPPCEPLARPCLFHITEDPCERNNLADTEPEKLAELLDRLEEYNRTAVPPANLPDDPRGDPKLWNHVFTNFGDYIIS